MSDDPTKNLPEPKYDTTPGVTAILERINQVRDELLQNDSQILTQLKEIDSQIRLMNRKFDIVSKELFETKAQALDAQTRVDELERKAS